MPDYKEHKWKQSRDVSCRGKMALADHSPPHYTALQIVNLDELPKSAGVVVVGSLCVAKCLQK